MSSAMAPMVNYIHTDASNLYFLVKWIPLGTPFGLFVGLTLTGVVCASERILTKTLDQASLELYQLQEDQLLALQEQTAASFSSSANSSAPDAVRRRARTNSGNGKQLQHQEGTDPVASSIPSVGGSGHGSGSVGGAGSLIHGSTSLTRLHLLQRRQMRRIVAKKTILYFCVNTLRLGYMLLAMSLHLGILMVIACSLTGTQLLLDCLGLRRSQKGTLEGYDRIGSSMELDHDFSQSSLRHVDRSDEEEFDDEDEDTDTRDIRRQQQQQQQDRGLRLQQHRHTQNTATVALHLSRSHDCA